ncbi:MAG: hypothetical protein Q7W51_10630 [Coriobacteriia bacterium]|nr:hypothetical protein [Coriobacteriia bacterium]
MDYFGILKKAWNITWKYKMLWVLGLFAGAGSSGGNSSTNSYQQGSGDASSASMDQFGRWVTDNVVLVAIIFGVLVVIGLVFWVLSIAAQGGLIHGANEAAEGRTPSLRNCWGVGFGKWGRTFMIYLMTALPIIAVVAVMTVLFIGVIGGGAAAGDEAAGLAAVGGICLLLPLMGFIILVLGVILSIVIQLALRYGVLDDVTFGQAIKRGWNDLWAKRGAFVMFLVMILPGIAYGFATLIVLIPFALPAVAAFMAGQYIIGVALFVLMILVLMVPGAIYGTFVSSAWTIFFRQMTGREPKTASVPATPPSYIPPPAPFAASDAPVPPAAEASAPVAEAPIVDVEPAPVTTWAADAAPEPIAAEAPPLVAAPEPPSPSAGFAVPESADVPATEAPPADEVPPADA